MSQKASAVKRAQQSEIQPHQLVLFQATVNHFWASAFCNDSPTSVNRDFG